LAEINDIISGCVRCDPKYQRLLYDRYRGYACKIVFRYIYHYEKAVDVVTDGFVKAFTHFASFDLKNCMDDPEKLLKGWLKRIMINCAIDDLRRSNLAPEIGRIPAEVWDISDTHDNADTLLLYKDLIGILKKLPPKYRIVLNLHVIDGYSYNEISEMLRIPANTCRSNCSRAKSLLIEMINKSEQIDYAGLRT
jgi:RNA polymerase sigma factor (sigma-70 family)